MAYRAFLKDTAIYGIAAILPRIIHLALVAVYTMVLGRVDFSDQTTWYVYAAFINVALTMGIETSFFRYYTGAEDKNKVVSSSFFIHLGTSCLFLLSGLALAGKINEFLGFSDPDFIRILVTITVLDTMVVIPFALLRVNGRPVRYLTVKMINILVLFAANVFFLLIIPWVLKNDPALAENVGIGSGFKPGVKHIIIANLIASLVTMILMMPEVLKIDWKPDRALTLKLLRYGWPIMVGGIAYAVNENVDKLLIQKLMDKESNGVYAACYKLGVFMTLYITAFRLGAEPFFFRHAASSDAREKYSTIMTWFVILGCLFMLFVTGFIDLLASLFLRNKVYTAGLYIVPVILLANLFSGIYANLSIWYKLTDRTRAGMYISIFGGILTIISLYVFVPPFGLMGGAIATLGTYFSMTMISYLFGRKYYPVPYEGRRIMFLIITSAALSGLSFLKFRGNYLISVLLLITMCLIILVMERARVKALITGKT